MKRLVCLCIQLVRSFVHCLVLSFFPSFFMDSSTCIKYNEKVRFGELNWLFPLFFLSFFFLSRTATAATVAIDTHAHTQLSDCCCCCCWALLFPLADIRIEAAASSFSRFLLLLHCIEALPFLTPPPPPDRPKHFVFKSKKTLTLALAPAVLVKWLIFFPPPSQSHKKMANSHDKTLWANAAALVYI